MVFPPYAIICNILLIKQYGRVNCVYEARGTRKLVVQEIGIALKPTASGAIIFNVAELSLEEAAQAAQDLQVLFESCTHTHAQLNCPCSLIYTISRANAWRLQFLCGSTAVYTPLRSFLCMQATLQHEGAGKELDNLKLLESMGLEVRALLALNSIACVVIA